MTCGLQIWQAFPMFVPFRGVFLAGMERLVALSTYSLLTISGIVLIVEAALFFLSTSSFNPEEILTKWK
jgi:hypothetical protein